MTVTEIANTTYHNLNLAYQSTDYLLNSVTPTEESLQHITLGTLTILNEEKPKPAIDLEKEQEKLRQNIKQREIFEKQFGNLARMGFADFRMLFDPANAWRYPTTVEVTEGKVAVQDRTFEMQLLGIGESAKVDFKQPASSPAITNTARSAAAMWVPKAFVARLPAAHPETEVGNGRYGTLKDPDANVFMRIPGGEWQSAKDGMVILPGDEIRTAPDAKVKVLLDDGKTGTVEVKEGSLFRIETADVDKTTGDKTTLLDLAIGKVLVQAQKLQGGSKFEVRTPTTLTGVRGTVFEVTVKEKV